MLEKINKKSKLSFYFILYRELEINIYRIDVEVSIPSTQKWRYFEQNNRKNVISRQVNGEKVNGKNANSKNVMNHDKTNTFNAVYFQFQGLYILESLLYKNCNFISRNLTSIQEIFRIVEH